MSESLVITSGTVKGSTVDADGRDVVVSGNQCEVALTGRCREVKAIGNEHRVRVETAESIQLLGNGNVVEVGTLGAARINGSNNSLTWRTASHGRAPSFAIHGDGNSVSMLKGD